MEGPRAERPRWPVFTPLRGRPHPSETEMAQFPPAVTDRSRAPVVSLASSPHHLGVRRGDPSARFLKPSVRRGTSGDRTKQAGRTAPRRTAAVCNARPRDPSGPARPLSRGALGRPRPCGSAFGGASPGHAPRRNRRPTWLILPVAYACLKRLVN